MPSESDNNPAPIRIRVRDHGPLVIEGPAIVVDAEGRPFTLPTNKPLVALCRCGQSSSKPFCDGTHKTCGFLAADRATPGGA